MSFIYIILAILMVRFVFSIFLYNPFAGIIIFGLYFLYASYIRKQRKKAYSDAYYKQYSSQYQDAYQANQESTTSSSVKVDPNNVFDAEYTETEVR